MKARQRAGVGALAGGLAYYHACLKWHLSYAVTAGQLLQMALGSIQSIQARMRRVSRPSIRTTPLPPDKTPPDEAYPDKKPRTKTLHSVVPYPTLTVLWCLIYGLHRTAHGYSFIVIQDK